MKTKKVVVGFGLVLVFSLSSIRTGMTHCDTMDGPVVKAAQEPLDFGLATGCASVLP